METVGHRVRRRTTMGQECKQGDPVLASNIDDSIFVAEKLSLSIELCQILHRARAGPLPTFSSSASDTSSSSLAEYYFFLINIIIINSTPFLLHGMNMNHKNLYINYIFNIVLNRNLPDIIPETALSCHTDERTYEERSVEENIELM